MKWLKTTVVYDSGDPETAAALIGDIFREYGLKGVIVESPDTEADPDGRTAPDWADNAFPAADRLAVIGFFPEQYQDPPHRRRFEKQLDALKPAIIESFDVFYSDVDEEEWAESWKSHFHPVRITERIIVRPGWQPCETSENDLVIEIDPGMAFGTGTHPTTALCIRLIERHLSPGGSFLDIGTGSGILMIAAAKLGAAKTAGTDCDPMAVEIAGRNLAANHIPPDRFVLFEGDLTAGASALADGPYDMIAANIVAETIAELIADIPPILSEKGIFIASGIIVEKEEMILEKLAEQGFETVAVLNREGWSGIAASRKSTQKD